MKLRCRLKQKIKGRYQKTMHRLLNGIDRLSQYPKPRYHARTLVEPAADRIGVAIIGCGFVADFYAATMGLHPELKLIGVMDHEPARAERFSALYGGIVYPSLEAVLNDPTVEIVANLTNPHSHFEISKAGLLSKKHVYSEKPLALDLEQARELVSLADRQGVILSSAPCSILGESGMAVREALRRKDVGRVRLVYAELDDGPIHQMQPEEWASPAGTPWPWRDEFMVGCTMEHAAYHLTWLAVLFGPARSVTAFSTCIVPDKHPDLAREECAPDFSVGCIIFDSGVVARITCGVVAPHDHSLTIIGDKGVLSVDECWHFGAPIRLKRFDDLTLRAGAYTWLARHSLTRKLFGLEGRKSSLSPKAGWRRRIRRHEMDYALGLSEIAAAIRERRPCRLPASLALHVNELALAIHHSREMGCAVPIRSTFPPLD